MSSSARSALNPKGSAQAYSEILKPLSQLDLDASTGRGGIREGARAEAARAGYEQGFREGFEHGEREAVARFDESHRQAMAAFVEELAQRSDRMEASFSEWVIQLEGPLASLASVIAARIVAQELATDPATIASITRQALADVTHAQEARIRVNPFDSETLRALRSDLLAASSGLRHVEIVDDPTILGGCVVETDGGAIDARVESMLEKALSTLRGER